MEIVLNECKHGIPLVNGMGCMICSNRTPSDKIYVNLNRGTRETQMNRRLASLGDKVEEIPIEAFI